MELTDRTIERETVMALPRAEAWARWTTHAGLLTFFGADNRVELRQGGPYEIYFLMDQPYGLRGSEGCTILSYLPEHMLSFTWNAPPDQPFVRDNPYKTFVVLNFDDAEGGTRVRLTHLGWPAGDAWDTAFAYFENAWTRVMQWAADASRQSPGE